MKTFTHPRSGVLAALGAACLLSGCASDRQPAAPGPISERDRYLYPRRYSDSLDPRERAEAERREEERRRALEDGIPTKKGP